MLINVRGVFGSYSFVGFMTDLSMFDAGRGVLVGRAEPDSAVGGAVSELCSRRRSTAGHHSPTGVR